MKPLIVILTILSVLGILLGLDFIIQHWPHGYLILYSGIGGCILTLLLALRYKK